jgi:hypothetical protein
MEAKVEEICDMKMGMDIDMAEHVNGDGEEEYGDSCAKVEGLSSCSAKTAWGSTESEKPEMATREKRMKLVLWEDGKRVD